MQNDDLFEGLKRTNKKQKTKFKKKIQANSVDFPG